MYIWRVFENRVLRRLCGPKSEEVEDVRRNWRKFPVVLQKIT
jgi:hypothetical protein